MNTNQVLVILFAKHGPRFPPLSELFSPLPLCSARRFGTELPLKITRSHPPDPDTLIWPLPVVDISFLHPWAQLAAMYLV
jgi:hypothetical protein